MDGGGGVPGVGVGVGVGEEGVLVVVMLFSRMLPRDRVRVL